LDKVVELLTDEYVIDKPPMMEGRFMSMVIRPKK
jgi:translation initiation factor IF-3